jgi:hypothetical protein
MDKFMTEDEKARVDIYIRQLDEAIGLYKVKHEEWEEVEDYYCNDTEEVENMPNSKINMINSMIEGQVAGLIEQNIAVTAKGVGPSDQSFAEMATIGIDWVFRKNKIKLITEGHERRRLKFGAGVLKVDWDANAISGFGLSKIFNVPLNKVYFDPLIKDHMRVEECRFIFETITMSKDSAIETFGEDKASAIEYGETNYRDNGIFLEEHANETDDLWVLIQRWSKHKGKLRVEEFTPTGFLLYDSHKEGDRKTNQKKKKEMHTSYHKYVHDEYPYFLTLMYPKEGELIGFGDGKLLLPIQKMVNELYDKIRICSRPNAILVDTSIDVDVDDFDENSFLPKYFDGEQANGRVPIHVIPWGQVNDAFWRLIDYIKDEAQRVVRFSDLMMGQPKSSETATEAAIQQQQGGAGIDQKKQVFAVTLEEVAKYCLGLMMEHVTAAKAIRLTEEEPHKFAWVDFRKLQEVPIVQPATGQYRRQFRDSNPGVDIPQYMNIEENGKSKMKDVELDIEITVGAGLPKNKSFLWQMVQQIAQITTVDGTTGQQKPLLNYQELRKFVKEYLGIPLTDEEMNGLAQNLQVPMQPQQQPMMDMNADMSGLTTGNKPAMGRPQRGTNTAMNGAF